MLVSEEGLGEKLQAWSDEFALKLGIPQWIPVLVTKTEGVAAAVVCHEHAAARGTDTPVEGECEDCAIHIDPSIHLLPESVQRAVIAHEIAHYRLGYTRLWNWLDDTQRWWRRLWKVSLFAILISYFAYLDGTPAFTAFLLSALFAVLTVLGLWGVWRHSRESQEVELKADELAIRQLGVEPDIYWQLAISHGELFRQRIPVISAFNSHPGSKRRITHALGLLQPAVR